MTNIKATKKALISSVLALVMCFTMLLGTTFAWFTDSVTSAGNIIQSGNLDVEMYWANGAKDVPAVDSADWQDASKIAIFNSKLWEPGYTEARHILVANKGSLALNYRMRIVANGTVSKLADVIDVYYFEDAAKVVDRDLDAKAAADPDDGIMYLGTLTEVLGTNKNISKSVKLDNLAANTTDDLTLVLKMRESAGNEYQNLSIGFDFSVELIATQATVESDSFDEKYDANVSYPEIPAALVRPLEDLHIKTISWNGSYDFDGKGEGDMNVGYQFEPTISKEDVTNSEFRHWHADFVVSADKDVKAGAIALAGQYNAFGDFWVALTSPEDVKAGEEVRLVNNFACVTYKDICGYGNDGAGFKCGAIALDDSIAGTTITVELRVFKTEGSYADSTHTCVETGAEDYITIGTFKYTFPKVVKDEAGLAESLAEGGTINLSAGEYKMPSSGSNNTLNIVGTKDTVIDVTKGAYVENGKVTFDGVTIKTGTGMVNGNGSDYAALYSPDVTYINCTFVGPMRVGRDGAKFINCTFTELGNDYVWTYGNDVTFEGCTFNTDGKAILIYSDGGDEVSKVTVKDCVFNSTQGAKASAISNQNCAAIEIHNYGNGVDLVTSGNTYDSNFSGEWRIKAYVSGGDDIIVNGVEYTDEALDGTILNVVGGKVQ